MVQALSPTLTVPTRQKMQQLITAKRMSYCEGLQCHVASSVQWFSKPATHRHKYMA